MKTLGLTSGQVRATVAWQATTIALAAVLVGVPVGLAAARWVWLLFARQLGIVPEPAFPLLAVGALGVATILVANLVALLPGRVAARTSPLVLRRVRISGQPAGTRLQGVQLPAERRGSPSCRPFSPQAAR